MKTIPPHPLALTSLSADSDVDPLLAELISVQRRSLGPDRFMNNVSIPSIFVHAGVRSFTTRLVTTAPTVKNDKGTVEIML